MTPSELDENINLTVQKIDKYFKWTADSAWKRLLTLIAFGVLMLTLQSFYLNHLVSKMDERTSAYVTTSSILEKEIKFKLAIDWINACKSKEESKNKSLYCKNAINHYKNISRKDDKDSQEFIVNNAYEAMLVDLNNKVRRLEPKRLLLLSKSPEYDLLKVLLDKTTVAIYIGLMLFVIICLSFAMFRYSKKHSENV